MEEKIKTYCDAVQHNLNNCFNKKKGTFINEKRYIDPDNYTYHEVLVIPKIMLDPNEQFSIGIKTDGLLSHGKLMNVYKELEPKVSPKDLYITFRQGMENVLVWPSRTWSINQARRSLGNDDRLDILLMNIECFYVCCDKYNRSLSSGFIKEIMETLPNMCYAFLNMPTLIWLCQYESFTEFIMNRQLSAFVSTKENEYHAFEWENYYKSLYLKTLDYRDEVLNN